MSDELLPVLLDIQKNLGEMKGTLASHVTIFEQHVADDRKAYGAILSMKEEQARQAVTMLQHAEADQKAWTDIEKLKDVTAKQKGFVAAMGAVGGGVIAALGYLIDKVLHH